MVPATVLGPVSRLAANSAPSIDVSIDWGFFKVELLWGAYSCAPGMKSSIGFSWDIF